MAEEALHTFLGKGLIFPITLTASGRPPIDGGFPLIESSLKTILSWAVGTRYYLGEFGSKLEQLLQEPNDGVIKALVKHFTVDVISQWEKRVEILEVQLDSKDDQSISIAIRYRIKNTKLENSFIFPYYSQLID